MTELGVDTDANARCDRLERALAEQSQRLAALGALLGDTGRELAPLAVELREALSAITTRASAGAAPDAAVIRQLTTVERHLARQVDRLAALGRARTEVDDRVDFAALVRAVVATVNPFARRRAVELRAMVPSEPVWVAASPKRLEQAMVNLLAGALDARRLLVHVDGDRETVRLRLIASGNRQPPTGQGIELVRDVVRSCGGTLSVRSGADGMVATVQLASAAA